ncbi:nitroreductase [Sphingomonas lacunae]|uniref:Putative NAD(P)H nitroreductase n=1 Tax=Sphingomonas lacunae TaxID=2698828 RepID=A0A6M4ARV7_9SPHN|nr:nitroreductase [Sphingomonas lacunae]QJQ31092.1 nitroreductase [Sphingomonas lacunae]
MFNDPSSALSLLLSRRSGKARDMIGPGPDAAELDLILRAATRVPDHGKLNPWRLVVIPQEERAAFGAMLCDAYRAERPDAGRLEIEAMDSFAKVAPLMIALLSTPVESSKIPLWEQQMSVGAVAMQLLNAAHALGFVGNWLTGWPSFNRAVAESLGARGAEDRVAGFFFFGTAAKPLEERPRPEIAQVVSTWPVVAR